MSANILPSGSFTSLISMQASMKNIRSIKSAQNELGTEALIYQPSTAFKGDPQKAQELTGRAQDLNGKISKICSDIQQQSDQINSQKQNEKISAGDPAQESSQTQDTASAGQSSSDNEAGVQAAENSAGQTQDSILSSSGNSLDVCV